MNQNERLNELREAAIANEEDAPTHEARDAWRKVSDWLWNAMYRNGLRRVEAVGMASIYVNRAMTFE